MGLEAQQFFRHRRVQAHRGAQMLEPHPHAHRHRQRLDDLGRGVVDDVRAEFLHRWSDQEAVIELPSFNRVVRVSLRYGRTQQLEEGYGIPLEPLETLARTAYADDPAKGWKAKANPELVAKTKLALGKLASVKLTYVPGHAGVRGNELADALARQAVDARRTSGSLAKKA